MRAAARSAGQLFCGDSELSAAAENLSAAIEARLSRLPDRLPAIEENALWIRQRNLSCGIFGQTAVRTDDIDRVKTCRLRETDERAAILRDPDFDCLAANTAAGALICSDPELALAEEELNSKVLGLIGKLTPTEARFAFAEYGRWTRERDRKCDLVGKENVPPAELPSAQGCLAEYLSRKTADILGAKGDPKRVFGRQIAARLPDTDAADFCVAKIHAANSCGDFVRISRVFATGSDVGEQEAKVTADIDMVVLSPFTTCSPVASSCTGTCWDPRSGNAQPAAASRQGSRESFNVTRRLRIQRTFVFQKAADGWRCREDELAPVESGVAGGGS
ncbi:lysozyme inhibitor LprI family protein [Bradyrhizobium sp. UFLA05-109]